MCKRCYRLNCYKLVYSIGAWADNRVVEIKFMPVNGQSITWNTVNGTLNVSNPTNINHWNMQAPITQSQFPIFPLKVFCGDKFIFTFNNDGGTPNAFACAANIDGIIYRTANNTNPSYPHKIVLIPQTGYTIVNPTYSPTTDLVTRNIVDTINYISVNPNNSNTSNYVLSWTI
jgi:hypothetical protein